MKKTQINGMIYYVNGLEESMLKYLYFSKESPGSIFTKVLKIFFMETEKNMKFIWNLERPQLAKEIFERIKFKTSHFLISSCITKSPRNQITITLVYAQIHRPLGQNSEPRNKTKHIQAINIQHRPKCTWEKSSLFNK